MLEFLDYFMTLVFKARHKFKDVAQKTEHSEPNTTIRAYANFAKNVPFLLLFLLLTEINGLH
jgi:uncharacterized membrane protein YecN with MAPEG domain